MVIITYDQCIGARYYIDEKKPTFPLCSQTTGMSGHTFLGAVPFLAVYSLTDKIWLRYTAVTLSTFVGISRINDDRHYLSQVIGGWSMAFIAAHTILRNQVPDKKMSLMVTPGFCGLSIKI